MPGHVAQQVVGTQHLDDADLPNPMTLPHQPTTELRATAALAVLLSECRGALLPRFLRAVDAPPAWLKRPDAWAIRVEEGHDEGRFDVSMNLDGVLRLVIEGKVDDARLDLKQMKKYVRVARDAARGETVRVVGVTAVDDSENVAQIAKRVAVKLGVPRSTVAGLRWNDIRAMVTEAFGIDDRSARRQLRRVARGLDVPHASRVAHQFVAYMEEFMRDPQHPWTLPADEAKEVMITCQTAWWVPVCLKSKLCFRFKGRPQPMRYLALFDMARGEITHVGRVTRLLPKMPRHDFLGYADVRAGLKASPDLRADIETWGDCIGPTAIVSKWTRLRRAIPKKIARLHTTHLDHTYVQMTDLLSAKDTGAFVAD